MPAMMGGASGGFLVGGIGVPPPHYFVPECSSVEASFSSVLACQQRSHCHWLVPPRPLERSILAVCWPNKVWSRPVLSDHGELAASEQAQLEAARAKRGWRSISRALTLQFSKSTHRRSSFQPPPRGAASGAASAQLPPRVVAGPTSGCWSRGPVKLVKGFRRTAGSCCGPKKLQAG
jgi:hypothetical protein